MRVIREQIEPNDDNEVSGIISEDSNETIFSEHGMLYSIDRNTKNVEEKGYGEMKLFRNPCTNEMTLHMVDETTSDILCFHVIDRLTQLRRDNPVDKCSWVWSTTADSSTGSRQSEWFRISFNTIDKADSFYKAFHYTSNIISDLDDLIQSELPLHDTSHLDEDLIFVSEELPSDDLMMKAEHYLLPRSFYNYLTKPPCPGCIGCSVDPSVTLMDESTNVDDTKSHTPSTPPKLVPVSTPSITNMGIFGKAASGFLSFTDIATDSPSGFDTDQTEGFMFQGSGQQLFSSPRVDDSEYNPEEEVEIHVKPIVKLPETYNYQSGEENAEVLFNERAKLFRYDSKTKQFKERGIGNIKILKYLDTGRIRILMRREQILKLCCNHYIAAGMKIDNHLGNEKALIWHTSADYSESIGTQEQFVVRFKLPATADKFKKTFQEAVEAVEPQIQHTTHNKQYWYCEHCNAHNEIDEIFCGCCSKEKSHDIESHDSESNQDACGLSQSSIPDLVDITPQNSQDNTTS